MSGVATQCVSHRDLLWNVLQGINQEINPAILEELKPIFLILELDVTTEVFGVKTVTELYNVLLRHYNNDFRKVVLAMREVFPVVVKDSHELEEDLILVCNHITEEYEEVGLPHDSVLYGRDTEMEKLLSYLDFNKDVNTRLINVCGMAGIGKSFLVKHLALKLMDKGDVVMVYVDLSQMKEVKLGDILLLNSKIMNFLEMSSRGNMVLILDDLASHMTRSSEARDVLKLLNDIFLSIKKSNKKLKIVMTSQAQLTVTSDKVTEQADLAKIRRDMKDYTKDVSLSRLTHDDSLKFLSASLHTISDIQKERLVKYCNGHPYLLRLLREKAARDFSLTAEVTNLTTLDLEADGAILTKLLPAEYESFTDAQKDVLLTAGIYGQDITVKALYQILKPQCDSKAFYSQVTQDFMGGFWLRVKIFNDIKSQAKRKTILGVHHPLIMKFLQSQVHTHLEEGEGSLMYQRIVMLKESFVRHNVTEMVVIGRDLMSQKVGSAVDNNLKQITDRFSLMKSTFKLMTNEIAASAGPGLLLFTTDGAALRSCSDIAHLFLCAFEYYDWFDGFLMDMLREAVLKPTDDSAHRVLLWTLYLLALVKDKDYRAIQAVVEKPMADKDPKLLITMSQELYHLSKALNNFSHSLYLVRAPWLKERIDDDLFANRDKVSTTAQDDFNRKYLSMDWSNVRTYFSVHLTIAQAEAKKSTRPRSPEVISQAFDICEKALNEEERVPLIAAAVYEYMAELRFTEGCEWYRKQLVGKTKNKFEDSERYRLKALEAIESRNMQRSDIGVRNRLAYAILLRSSANIKADKDKDLDLAIKKIKEAIVEGKKVVRLEELLALGTTSKRMLYRAYEDHGVCYAYLAEFYGRLGDRVSLISKKRHTRDAFRFLNRAYTLIFHNYRSCQFSLNDPMLSRLIGTLPKVMRSVGIQKEIVEKAEMNLLNSITQSCDQVCKPSNLFTSIVQQQANKEGEEDINLSGSELDSCSSSERESSDDDLANSAAAPSQSAAQSDEASSSKRFRN